MRTPIGQLTMLKLPDDAFVTVGRQIELVQWPAGHTDGITAADRPEEGD